MQSLLQKFNIPHLDPQNPARVFLLDLKRLDIPKRASAMAYVTLLSLVPCLAVSFSLISVFSPLGGEGGAASNWIKDLVFSHLTETSGAEVSAALNSFISKLDMTKIGITATIGLLVTLVLLLRQIEMVLNQIWLVDRERNMFTRFVYFWTFITLGSFLASLGFGLVSKYLTKASKVAQVTPWMDDLQKWCTGFGVTLAFFFFLYKFVPNHSVRTRAAFFGGLFASFTFQLASWAFSFYMGSIANYQAVYGALAALPLFLTWLYLCWVIILAGAVLAWRFDFGFPVQNTTQDFNSPLDNQPLNQKRLQSLLPIFVLAAIYRVNHSKPGKGITGHECQRLFKLPIGWIQDALKALHAANYIVPAFDDTEQQTSFCDYSFYPSTPAPLLSLTKVFSDIMEPLTGWLSLWREDLDEDYVGFVEFLTKVPPEKRESSNIQDMLASYFKG